MSSFHGFWRALHREAIILQQDGLNSSEVKRELMSRMLSPDIRPHIESAPVSHQPQINLLMLQQSLSHEEALTAWLLHHELSTMRQEGYSDPVDTLKNRVTMSSDSSKVDPQKVNVQEVTHAPISNPPQLSTIVTSRPPVPVSVSDFVSTSPTSIVRNQSKSTIGEVSDDEYTALIANKQKAYSHSGIRAATHISHLGSKRKKPDMKSSSSRKQSRSMSPPSGGAGSVSKKKPRRPIEERPFQHPSI